jgi:SpoVK/Ycf46/Vps4 family AAA+-type ATPase
MVLATAQKVVAVLFFDEADSKFGKKTEVKDTHDKYANIEVVYLWQISENYEGITGIAANAKNSIDSAFLRRFHSVINFSK